MEAREPSEAFQVEFSYRDRRIEVRSNFGLAFTLEPAFGAMHTLTSCCGVEARETCGGTYSWICDLCYRGVDGPKRGWLKEDRHDIEAWVEDHISVLFATPVAEDLRDRLVKLASAVASSQDSRWGMKDIYSYVARASCEIG